MQIQNQSISPLNWPIIMIKDDFARQRSYLSINAKIITFHWINPIIHSIWIHISLSHSHFSTIFCILHNYYIIFIAICTDMCKIWLMLCSMNTTVQWNINGLFYNCFITVLIQFLAVLPAILALLLESVLLLLLQLLNVLSYSCVCNWRDKIEFQFTTILQLFCNCFVLII